VLALSIEEKKTLMQFDNLPSNIYIKSSVFSYCLHFSYLDIEKDAMLQNNSLMKVLVPWSRNRKRDAHSNQSVSEKGRQRRGMYWLACSTDRFLLCNRNNCATRALHLSLNAGGSAMSFGLIDSTMVLSMNR
jgi:hypothetical protein